MAVHVYNDVFTMGPAAGVLQNSFSSQAGHFFEQRQVRFCGTPTLSRYQALSGVADLRSQRLTGHRYQAVLGIANSPFKPFTSRGYRPSSRPLSQHKLCAKSQEEAYQEVHDYIVLFKVPQSTDWHHTTCSVADVASNATSFPSGT